MKYNNNPIQQDENIDIAKLFSRFYAYWKYFFYIGFICIIIAIIFILVTPSQYKIKSSLQLISESSGMTSELKMLKATALGSMFSASGAGVNANDEVLLIQSKVITGEMISKLGLQVDIKNKEGLKMISAYKKSPIALEFPTNFLDTLSKPISVKLSISNQKADIKLKSALFEEKNLNDVSLPYIIQSGIGNIKISKTGNFKLEDDKDLEINIYPLNYIYELYLEKLVIAPADAGSDIIELSLKDENKERGTDILNTTMEIYNDYSKSVKVIKSAVNASFVKEKLALVTSELDSLEKKIEIYKKQNKIPDLEAYGSVVYMGSEESNKKILDLQTQLKSMNYVLSYIKNPNNQYAIVPNISYGDEALTSAYNKLMFERFRLLKSTEPSNPAIVLINDQLKEQRKVLIETINSAIKGLEITINEVNKKDLSLNSQLNKLPAQEKEFIEMKRAQKVKETLYLFLLQKIQEKEISNAPDEMASRIVDHAYCSFKPVFPKKIIVFAVAFLASIILSIIIISIRLFFIKKTASKEDFDDNLSYPIWGKFTDYESFRIIRNFVYSKDKQSQIFIVTSNIEGEGKTYFSSNLAKSLSMTDKKVALVNMDFTKQPDSFKDKKNQFTLNQYISSDIDLDRILIKETPNLTFIQSEQSHEDCGNLVYSSKMELLINYLKTNYDYVIIDSTSLSISLSAYDIAHLVDYTFFVIRKEFTPKSKLKNINNIIESGLLPNVCIVMNSNISK